MHVFQSFKYAKLTVRVQLKSTVEDLMITSLVPTVHSMLLLPPFSQCGGPQGSAGEATVQVIQVVPGKCLPRARVSLCM